MFIPVTINSRILYNEESEALRILSFYYDKPLSEIVRTILHNGILKMVEGINLPNIFGSACQRLADEPNVLLPNTSMYDCCEPKNHDSPANESLAFHSLWADERYPHALRKHHS